MILAAVAAVNTISGRNPWLFGGNIGPIMGGMVIFYCKEITMPVVTALAVKDDPPDPITRLDALIAAALADIAEAEGDEAAAEAELEAIEPHPHAHGHTAGGDCGYAGFRPEHRLALAGLLARPWQPTLTELQALQRTHHLDYLLKAFPVLLDSEEASLADEGAVALIERGEAPHDRFAHKPMLGIGMVWHAFGFHHRDRLAWMGAFAQRDSLEGIIERTTGVTPETAFGVALAAAVKAQSAQWSSWGRQEMVRRAAAKNAERQESWASVPEEYRKNGSWRPKAPTKRQRHLMQRIEAARSLPMTVPGRRGDVSDWITTSGGNPRFVHLEREKA